MEPSSPLLSFVDTSVFVIVARALRSAHLSLTLSRTHTNPNDTEANILPAEDYARALRASQYRKGGGLDKAGSMLFSQPPLEWKLLSNKSQR